MKLWTLVVAAGAIVAGGLLAGCSSDEADAPGTTSAAVATTSTSAVASPTTTAVATTTTEAMDADAACIDCHTNQETLMALAVAPADAESLNSGEG